MGSRIFLKLRPMIECDFEYVRTASEEAYQQKMSGDEFFCSIYSQDRIALVATCQEEPVGYMLLINYQYTFEIEQLVTSPKYRRSGVATFFIQHLRDKREKTKRKIAVNICEKMLAGQLFLRDVGFFMVNTFPGTCGCGADIRRFVSRFGNPNAKT